MCHAEGNGNRPLASASGRRGSRLRRGNDLDPIARAESIQDIVCTTEGGVPVKRYWRFRDSRHYGGVVAADAAGCNLHCLYCWASEKVTQPPAKVGEFYTPSQVAEKLHAIAERKGLKRLRVTGGEPTIGRDHLVALLREIDKKYLFILETNGILIGHDPSYAESLAEFPNLRARVSVKAATPEQFERITGADAKGFGLQLEALRNLVRTGVRCHPAILVSFSSDKDLTELRRRIGSIDRGLADEIEEEEYLPYGQSAERLRRAGIQVPNSP